MPCHLRYLLTSVIILSSSLVFPIANHLAYAHTFSTSEGAEFLSLVGQVRAEMRLVTMILGNNDNNDNNGNNATTVPLAQAHAEKASSLLDNNTIGEIREKNNRIANSLESGLKQLVENVTSATASSSTSRGQISHDKAQSINQIVTSLNDTIAEAVSTRVEREQQDNATTWALALGDLVNVVLSNYGNATGSTFDLTDMSNMVGGDIEDIHMNHKSNMTMMAGNEQLQMSGNSSSNNSGETNTMTMTMGQNNTSPSSPLMNTMTATTIVDEASYRSAQYLANNTIPRLFYDALKPITNTGSNEVSADNNNNSNSSINISTTMTMHQQGQNTPATPDGDMISDIDRLEAGLQQLKDNINNKATLNEVMITAHTRIHPVLVQIYGLTLEQEHTNHDVGQ